MRAIVGILQLRESFVCPVAGTIVVVEPYPSFQLKMMLRT
jgi:hypothetical protein